MLGCNRHWATFGFMLEGINTDDKGLYIHKGRVELATFDDDDMLMMF